MAAHASALTVRARGVLPVQFTQYSEGAAQTSSHPWSSPGNVSASTLSRIENGTGKPDADNIARLTGWLDMPIDRVMNKQVSDVEPVIYYPHEPVPEIVEAHLRADKKLTPETAKALSELFRVAYKQFSRPGED